jgi:hypothetical protein
VHDDQQPLVVCVDRPVSKARQLSIACGVIDSIASGPNAGSRCALRFER